MALLWYDGFDGLAVGSVVTMYDAYGSTSFLGIASNPRTGSGCMSIGDSSSYLEKNLTFGSATAILGFGFRLRAGIGATRTILQIKEGSTVHLKLVIKTSQVLELQRGDGTVLATGSTALPAGTAATDFRYVELAATIHDTAGAYTLWINDVQEFTASGVDTRNAGSTGTPDRIKWMFDGWPQAADFDDIYVLDDTGGSNNARLTSGAKVLTLDATAAGDLTEWTASSGSNYQCVDEATDNGDTDYVSAASTGLRDFYNCADMPAGSYAIKAVRGAVVARKDDAGSNSIQVKVRSSSTDNASGNKALTTSYAVYLGNTLLTDPATSAAWTASAVSAAQVGVERTV